jgi:hypothetical protein
MLTLTRYKMTLVTGQRDRVSGKNVDVPIHNPWYFYLNKKSTLKVQLRKTMQSFAHGVTAKIPSSQLIRESKK